MESETLKYSIIIMSALGVVFDTIRNVWDTM